MRFLGLMGGEIVDIPAGRGINGGPRGPQRRGIQQQPQQMRSMSASNGNGAYAVAGGGGGVATMAPPPTVAAAIQGLPAPAAAGTDPAMINKIFDEMGQMRKIVAELERRERLKDGPDIAPELFDDYTLLVDNQVERELAEHICTTLHKTLRSDHLQQRQFVREKIAEQIERLLPTAGPITRTKTNGPHVVALIGPTGVGKTTTIAKLAANLKLREKRKVGLITIDTYRIAAIDQLKKYADIIGSPLRVVGNPEDLREAVKAMSDCDYILIDTAGRSPKDTLKLHELKNFLAAAGPDEVHLVLSTTASQECVELAIERFTDVRVDKIIFTKIDEAAHVGVVLNVVRKVNKALSYVTTGQDVPDDIEDARGIKLAQLILNGSTIKQDLPPN
jgi:flagellar biosynthesis protein FlhF